MLQKASSRGSLSMAHSTAWPGSAACWSHWALVRCFIALPFDRTSLQEIYKDQCISCQDYDHKISGYLKWPFCERRLLLNVNTTSISRYISSAPSSRYPCNSETILFIHWLPSFKQPQMVWWVSVFMTYLLFGPWYSGDLSDARSSCSRCYFQRK